MRLTLGELAERSGASLHGDAALPIEGVCTLQEGRAGCIGFLANPHYRKYLAGTRAALVAATDRFAQP